jgi:DNA-binding transcriptional MerR regulator
LLSLLLGKRYRTGASGMATFSRTPSYNLKVVVRETGINPDTLRAWERRYGLPSPQRTAGGHRLYSQRDLETIRWLMARQAEGMSISSAVKLWREMEKAGQDPLQSVAQPAVTTKAPGQISGSTLVDIRQAWVQACLNFDEGAAEQQLTRAFSLYAPELVCQEIIQKGLADIGGLWYANRATVQQEHFASALALRRLNALLASAPTPIRTQQMLVGCPPEEEHTFAPLLLALLLRYRGWGVIYLGANVPLPRFETALQATKPQLVILTAQTLHTAAKLSEVAHFLQAKQFPLAYGGEVFNRLPVLRGYLPGYFIGEVLVEAPKRVEEVLIAAPPMPTGIVVSDTYRRALSEYRAKQGIMEGYVWQILRSEGISPEHLRTTNFQFARDITAALTFGDMALLDQEIAWTEQLLVNYEIPHSFLKRYLVVYYHVAREHLSAACQSVIEWLARVSTNMA